MLLSLFPRSLVLSLSLLLAIACSTLALPRMSTRQAAQPDQASDPISGEWNVSFFVHGHTTPAVFTLKLNGNTVTGTAFSDHTGPGTVRDGKWKNGKLSFTLDFAKHDSIVITGQLQNTKLVGEFHTEGFVANWEAVKK